MSGLQQLYAEVIREHAANPVGYQPAFDATHRHEALNPLCGDRVVILGRLVDEQIEAIGFEGEACTICMASASLLCQCVGGAPIAQLKRTQQAFSAALEGQELPEDLEALNALVAVRQYPSRVQCATLPWGAAIQAFERPL